MNADAADAASPRSSFVRELRQGFATLGRIFFGARTAEALSSEARSKKTQSPAPGVIATTEDTMAKAKVSSRRLASIASRVMRGGAYTHEEVEALAGSVVSQAKASRAAKKKRPAAKKR